VAMINSEHDAIIVAMPPGPMAVLYQ
jgi:hypothetical protein